MVSAEPPEKFSIGNPQAAGMDFIRIMAAVLLPPLGVFLQVGIGKQFWVSHGVALAP
jgi:hypothetical protein